MFGSTVGVSAPSSACLFVMFHLSIWNLHTDVNSIEGCLRNSITTIGSSLKSMALNLKQIIKFREHNFKQTQNEQDFSRNVPNELAPTRSRITLELRGFAHG